MTVGSGGEGGRRVGGSSRPDASHQPKYEGPFFLDICKNQLFSQKDMKSMPRADLSQCRLNIDLIFV